MTSTSSSICIYCGGYHPGQIVCPRIIKIEYYEDGHVKSLEFADKPPALPLRLGRGSITATWPALEGED
jgi:hypothetical protein